MTATAGQSDGQGDEPLRARLRVEPHESVGCAVLDAGDRGDDVVVNLDQPGSDRCDCRAAVTVEQDDDRTREYVEGPVGEHCVCLAFSETDCVAEIESVRGQALVVSVTVPRRDALQELVGALRDRDAIVRLEQVLPLDPGEDGQELRLPTGSVTEKQREAIAVAVDRGYYQQPRGADLESVADALGVSPSAASQRLNAAERTLIRALVDATDLSFAPDDRTGPGADDGRTAPGESLAD